MATTMFSTSKVANLIINDNALVGDVLNVDFFPYWFRIVDLQVFLGGLTHGSPDDLDFLLRGPNGLTFEFWSDAGGSADIINGNFTISDAAASALPDATAITSGTYRPADYGAVEPTTNNHPAPNGTA